MSSAVGAGLTALQAPSVLLPQQVLQGARRLENWSPGLRRVGTSLL